VLPAGCVLTCLNMAAETVMTETATRAVRIISLSNGNSEFRMDNGNAGINVILVHGQPDVQAQRWHLMYGLFALDRSQIRCEKRLVAEQFPLPILPLHVWRWPAPGRTATACPQQPPLRARHHRHARHPGAPSHRPRRVRSGAAADSRFPAPAGAAALGRISGLQAAQGDHADQASVGGHRIVAVHALGPAAQRQRCTGRQHRLQRLGR
jgi:hypothetical protein